MVTITFLFLWLDKNNGERKKKRKNKNTCKYESEGCFKSCQEVVVQISIFFYIGILFAANMLMMGGATWQGVGTGIHWWSSSSEPIMNTIRKNQMGPSHNQRGACSTNPNFEPHDLRGSIFSLKSQPLDHSTFLHLERI